MNTNNFVEYGGVDDEDDASDDGNNYYNDNAHNSDPDDNSDDTPHGIKHQISQSASWLFISFH